MQPDLLDYALTPVEPKKRRPTVRQTSKLAVTVKRDSGELQARAADICHWLAWRMNMGSEDHPTAVELAKWAGDKAVYAAPGTALARFGQLDPTARKNYISKGLWDAQQAAMVEAVPHGARLCAVNKRKATTWRLRTV